MNTRRTITVVAWLLAAAMARASDPAARLQRGVGAKRGLVVINGLPNGGDITSAKFYITFDPNAVEVPAAADAVVSTGWSGNYTRVSATEILLNLGSTRGSGQTATGPIAGVYFTFKNAGFQSTPITFADGSYVEGDDSDGIPTGPVSVSGQSSSFLFGKQIGIGSIGGAAAVNGVAVSRDNGVTAIAVAGDTTLSLLNADDPALAPLANWTGGLDLGGTVSGRPAFGGINGALAVAVGTDAGRAVVVNVANKTLLADANLTTNPIATAPAINGATNDVYWAVQGVNGPEIVRQHVNGTATGALLRTAAGDGSATITSSPAISNGMLVVGTSAAALAFRVDATSGALTAQAGGGITGDSFNTSPVVVGGSALIGSASGKVYKMNLMTGAQTGIAAHLPDTAAPLSDPFYNAASGKTAFGGSDGSVYFVDNAMDVTSATFGTAPLSAPVSTGSGVFVADANGRLGRISESAGVTSASVELGTSLGRAVAVTGTSGGTDQVIVNTQDGALLAMPLPG